MYADVVWCKKPQQIGVKDGNLQYTSVDMVTAIHHGFDDLKPTVRV